ncbi:MAG: exosortase-associated EpsI family protein [Akkermansiaceae bacterium]
MTFGKENEEGAIPENPVKDDPQVIIRRIYILASILAVGFSFIWLLPKSESMKLSCLSRHLPPTFGTMVGKRTEITGRELDILAKDTEFERFQYYNTQSPNHPLVETSVVFSGKDLNNSIHRPERCLRSQGWNIVKERSIVLKNVFPEGSGLPPDLPLREIVCKKPIMREDGSTFQAMRAQYYTFFGHTAITESHYGRTFQDMKDRLFKGYDQQWAYATFSVPVTKIYADQGLMQDGPRVFTLQQSEEILENFIRQLAPLVVD